MGLFDLLPIEIQRQIIEQIVTFKNLLALKLVSKRFKKLVEQIHDPNEPEGKHLKWSLSHGYHQEVARLLRDERILKGFNENKYLDYMVRFSDVKTIKTLLDDARIDPNIGAPFESPLLVACNLNRTDLVEMLLNHARVDIHFDNDQIFYRACYQGKLGLIQSLFGKTNFSPDIIYHGIKEACIGNRPQILKFLFAKYDPSPEDIIELLDVLSRFVMVKDIMMLLLDHESTQSSNREQRSQIYSKALYTCTVWGFTDIAKRLLDERDVVFDRNSICFPAIIQKKNPETLRLCLQYPNSTFSPDYNYSDLIHFDDVELVLLALKRGNVNIYSLFNRAFSFQKKEMIATILKEYRLCSRDQYPVLYLACIFNNVEVVGYLLENYTISLSHNEFHLFEIVCRMESYGLAQLLLKHKVFDLGCFENFWTDTVPYLIENGKREIVDLIKNNL